MGNSMFKIFGQLDDPRDNRGKKYKLIDVVMLALYGVLIGYEDFSNMAYYLKKREDELTVELGIENGVPSHDTFSAVFRMIDVEKFMVLFIEWTKSLVEVKTGKHIAIDGKAVRAATKKAEGGNIPYVLNAFLCGMGITIGQKQIGEKTNEITEIPKLLDLIDIKDCIITIDAIGTQKEIMDKIKEKNGHFCLQLKRNQRQAYENVKLYFDSISDREKKKLSSFSSTENDHGRLEKRKYSILTDAEMIKAVLQEDKWKHIKAIGMAELSRTIGENTSKETHFHLLDFEAKPEQYASLAREHWQIENSLHWVLDIHFNEDRCTANSDNALANLTILRKIAFNLTKLDPDMAKKSTKKRMIDFMTNISIFKKLVFETIPNA